MEAAPCALVASAAPATVCPKDAMGVYQQCDFYVNGAGQIEQINQVAGGAVDQYVGFSVGAAYVFGGVSPSYSPPADEPAPAPKKKKHKKKKGEKKPSAS